ncbi:MAG: hypothetical protein KIS66_14565 [Fimbriimonadaceae bacterium]|nr:hypothetical protein [Fimbriimonadaceae bacterium]
MFTSLFACLGVACPGLADYDPLVVRDADRVTTMDLTVCDEARKRDVPIRVFLPTVAGARPVVLFSHGLGGSREGSAYLARHWAARGYAVVFLQHLGSDESVWRNARPLDRLAAMRRAANAENFLLRTQDVAVVLDRLERWNAAREHALAGRLDLDRVGMSGHSFGAVTTQAVSGQVFAGKARYTDSRIRAALPMSPSSPQTVNPARAFGKVAIPWMLMTGTRDVAAIGDQDAASRLKVFPALPKGSKYELVLDGAEHSAFTDRGLPGDRQPRNPNHHRAILALSTAFWDAYLRDDPEARAWLDGFGPRTILERGDRWQRK